MRSLGCAGICTLVCGWVLGIATAAPKPPDWVRWFADDFEDGTASRWRVWDLDGRDSSDPMAWRVEQDGGNRVFAERAEFFAKPKTVRGSDYGVKARVRVIRGFLQVAVRHDCVCYFVALNADSVSLSRTRPCGVHTQLKSVREIHDPARWYVLEIVSIGSEVKVYVDDVLKISYTDPQPVPFGGVMFWTAGDSYVQVDDVEVMGPPVTAAGLQVTDVLLPNAVVGAPYTHTLTATGGTPPYKWNALLSLSLPEGLSLSEDGTIGGKLTKGDRYAVAVMVTDSVGDRAMEAFDLRADDAAITSDAVLPMGEVGTPYSTTLEVVGMPGCRWLAPELPPGLALDPASGVLSGTPALGGTYRVLIACMSGAGAPAAKYFGYYVTEPNPRPLAIATRPEELLDAELTGSAEGIKIAAAGGVPPYSWAVTSGELPRGMRLLAGRLLPGGSNPFDAMAGGYPVTAGKYRFTVEATDTAGAKASQELELQTTWISVTSDVDFPKILNMGAPFSGQFSAQGGIAPYRWAPLSLPAGLDMAPDGKLSGVPAECGFFPLVVQVTDSDSAPVTHRYGDDSAFVILCAKDSFSLVNIHAPAKITGAKVNEPFQYPIGLGNGTGKGYQCSLSGGALPPGLTLTDGTLPGVAMISGTPAEAGTFEFELRATDDGGNFGVRKLRLVVE